ncbi:MAG TPA: class I SAM-dependent methyltransferase [Armatimonadota bacterium]|jgi:SAM-dependent methyltransferase
MPLVSLEEISELLACPRCGTPVAASPGGYHCTAEGCALSTGDGFPLVAGRPALVDWERSILQRERVVASGGRSAVERSKPGGTSATLQGFLFDTTAVSRRNAARYLDLLAERGEAPRVLVVGGATQGLGAGQLYADPRVRVLAFDIYGSPLTQFIADAHQIPLSDGSVDGVWIQAVLEHVLDPWRVAEEIHRVVKPQGLLYAETPFLQQVHEGPYDFTRFTESGHRWLFRRFEGIDSGVVLGPGTHLSWTVDHTVRALTRSSLLGKLARAALFGARFLDRLAPEPIAVDAASHCFFLGRKTGRELQPKEMLRHYKGAQ